MKRLNLRLINLNSPYTVWTIGDSYYFLTDNGVTYKISFVADDMIWGEGAYLFNILNENHAPSPNDKKLRATIFYIIENFFDTNPDILLYICETGDGKQASRNRLFIKWFREYTKSDLFHFEGVEIIAEGVENFAALIVQKSNPDIDTIISDFREIVGTLKDKPNGI